MEDSVNTIYSCQEDVFEFYLIEKKGFHLFVHEYQLRTKVLNQATGR
jgi:hypothetical protein